MTLDSTRSRATIPAAEDRRQRALASTPGQAYCLPMRAHLMIPCLVEDCLPEIAEAVALVLERLGLDVSHPGGQTCCGQLAFKTGDIDNARRLALRYLDLFAAPGPVVCPSGSCVKMVKHYPELFAPGSEERERAEDLAGRTREFCAFIAGEPALMQKWERLGPHLKVRACLHASCQLERHEDAANDPVRRLLSSLRGLTLLDPERPDRCCGFGGIFSLQFTAVSEALVEDKCREILALDPQVLVSAEPSCLMNISGHLGRLGRPLPALHAAQLMAAAIQKKAPPWK